MSPLPFVRMAKHKDRVIYMLPFHLVISQRAVESLTINKWFVAWHNQHNIDANYLHHSGILSFRTQNNNKTKMVRFSVTLLALLVGSSYPSATTIQELYKGIIKQKWKGFQLLGSNA